MQTRRPQSGHSSRIGSPMTPQPAQTIGTTTVRPVTSFRSRELEFSRITRSQGKRKLRRVSCSTEATVKRSPCFRLILILKSKSNLSGQASLPSASLIAEKVNDWPINASVPSGRKCSIRSALRRHSSRKRRSAFSKFFRPLTKSGDRDHDCRRLDGTKRTRCDDGAAPLRRGLPPSMEAAAATTVGGTVRGPDAAAAAGTRRGGAATRGTGRWRARQRHARETSNPALKPPHAGAQTAARETDSGTQADAIQRE